jgi:hypothetical protein
MYLEPLVEPRFHPTPIGYRPGKAALEAVGDMPGVVLEVRLGHRFGSTSTRRAWSNDEQLLGRILEVHAANCGQLLRLRARTGP